MISFCRQQYLSNVYQSYFKNTDDQFIVMSKVRMTTDVKALNKKIEILNSVQ